MDFKKRVGEKVMKYGVEGLDMQTLLALIVGPEATPEITGRLASYDIDDLVDLTVKEIEGMGVSYGAALRIVAAFTIGRKIQGFKGKEHPYIIRTDQDAVLLVKNTLRHEKQEKFIVAFLNNTNLVLETKTIGIGGWNRITIEPRVIFRDALRYAASKIICYHNHPSYDPTPSPEDRNLTNVLVNYGNKVGIEVVNHYVIAGDKFTKIIN